MAASTPIDRYGVATEVRVMGDFDDWTMGVWLSCDSAAEDATMVTFEGKLYVPPVCDSSAPTLHAATCV